MTASRSSYGAAAAETSRLHKLPRRKPTAADRPPIKPPVGKRIPLIHGQLDLEGNEVGALPPDPTTETNEEEA